MELPINKIICGDALEILKTFPENCIDSIVTDPPAGIGFMGKEWDSDKGGKTEWIDWLSSVMVESLRVLKPGGHALVWALPRTSHWTGTALENAGFEVRDCVYHVFGSGFPKSLNISKAIDKRNGTEKIIGEHPNPGKAGTTHTRDGGAFAETVYLTEPNSPEAKQWEGWGSALKPATEIWLLCKKPLTTVPHKDIIEADNQIRNLLCQISPAKYVKLFSMSSQSVSEEEMLDFVQWIVAVSSITKSEELSEKMAMFRSLEEGKIFLNTVLLWSNIWAENLKKESKFTISTMSVLTTELKTLNSLIYLLMLGNTQCQETQVNGTKQFVKLVAELSNAVLTKLNNILIFIAPEFAIEKGVYHQKSESEISVESEIGTDDLVKKYPKVNHIWLVRKPLSEKSIVDNVLKWGMGGLNIDVSRVVSDEVISTHSNGKGNTGDKGVYGHFDKVKPGNERTGRFPAHLIHDGSEEVLAEFAKGGVSKSSGGRIGNKGSDLNMMGTNFKKGDPGFGDIGTPARFFYTAKPSKSEKDLGLEDMEEKDMGDMLSDNLREGGERRVGRIMKNFHPTVKAQALMKYLINLITPPKGIVLDCFAGSGSTLVAAKTLGFDCIGIELNEEYAKIAEQRFQNATYTPPVKEIQPTLNF